MRSSASWVSLVDAHPGEANRAIRKGVESESVARAKGHATAAGDSVSIARFPDDPATIDITCETNVAHVLNVVTAIRASPLFRINVGGLSSKVSSVDLFVVAKSLREFQYGF